MGHITPKSYYLLQKRLDMDAQGSPDSKALFKIFEILFTENEAKLVSLLPINFFTTEQATKIWGKSINESKKILNKLADKGILLDLKYKNTKAYILAPPMAGFFEFSIMRLDGKFDCKALSELFYEYINVEDDFFKEVFGLKTSLARPFVHEQSVQQKDKSLILDYEKASEVIKTATQVSVGRCYCRHKKEHLGKVCNNPQEVCLSFNFVAESLIKHKISREISKEEAFKILDECVSLGLVQIGDNVQNKIGWICNCCKCCCEALNAYRRVGFSGHFHTSFFAKNHKKTCIGCGICAFKCPVDAIKIKNKKAFFDYKKCIGCGVCVRFCKQKSIFLERKERLVYVPKDNFERFIDNAIETGKLQNYIFDNYNLWTNEMLRKFLGIILKLKPAKRLLAKRQLRSRFINKILKTKKYEIANDLLNMK